MSTSSPLNILTFMTNKPPMKVIKVYSTKCSRSYVQDAPQTPVQMQMLTSYPARIVSCLLLIQRHQHVIRTPGHAQAQHHSRSRLREGDSQEQCRPCPPE